MSQVAKEAEEEVSSFTNFVFDVTGDVIEDITDIPGNIVDLVDTTFRDLKKGSKRGFEDVMGFTSARKTREQTERQFNIIRQDRLDQRQEAKDISDREQVQLSRSAKRTSAGRSRSASRGQSRFSSLGGDERDFLGL